MIPQIEGRPRHVSAMAQTARTFAVVSAPSLEIGSGALDVDRIGDVVDSRVVVDSAPPSVEPVGSETGDSGATAVTTEMNCLDVHLLGLTVRGRDLLANVSFTARRGTTLVGKVRPDAHCSF